MLPCQNEVVRRLADARDEKFLQFPGLGASPNFLARVSQTGDSFLHTIRRSECVRSYNSRKLRGTPLGDLRQADPATMTARPSRFEQKENIQPLKFSTVAVFFLLSTVLSPISMGGLKGGFFFAFRLCFTLLFPIRSAHTWNFFLLLLSGFVLKSIS